MLGLAERREQEVIERVLAAPRSLVERMDAGARTVAAAARRPR